MRYRVSHTTRYAYSQPATLGHNQLRLVPRSEGRQRCRDMERIILPEPTFVSQWTDPFGNRVDYFSLDVPHRELVVTARSLVEVDPIPEPRAMESPTWETSRPATSAPGTMPLEVWPMLFDSPLVRRGTELREFAEPSFPAGRPLIAGVLDLTERIFREFHYDPTSTTVSTPTLEVLRRKRGVCQDFAHLELACLRSLGLAARYVSGYLLTDPPAGQPRLIGADASHAWLSVYTPGVGWLDVDPTNNAVVGERHVTVAWGRDYSDVCPVKGVVLGGGTHTLSVSVDVTPDEA